MCHNLTLLNLKYSAKKEKKNSTQVKVKKVATFKSTQVSVL